MKNLFTNSRTRWLGMVICTCMLLLWNAHAWAWQAHGTFNSWGDATMTQSSANSAVYYYAVSGTGISFKVTGDSGWGDHEMGSSYINNDLGNINLSGSGNISGGVTGTWYICYHSTDDKVYATTTNPNYPDMVIAGNNFGSIGSWSTTTTVMTSNGSGTYTKTIDNVAVGDCQFKIAYKGTWTGAKGYDSKKVSGTNCSSGPSDASGNISFTPAVAGSVTITYVQSTGAITIACPKFSVTYDGNGKTSGSVPTDASSPYNSGSTVTVKGNTGSLAKTGCVFDGWMTAQDGSGTTYAPGATFSITGPTTLYARWIAKTIYVYDNLSWGSMKVYTFESERNGSWSGTAATSLGSGWYRVDLLDGASKFILNNGTTQTEDITIASYSPTIADGHSYEVYGSDTKKKLRVKQLTVSFDMKSHGDQEDSQSIDYNGLVSEPDAPTATGYTFGGWYKETGCTNAWNFSTDKVTAATTLYAKWTKKTFIVTVNNDGHGSTSPSGAQSSIAQVDGVAISASADDDYEFNNWTIESGTGSFTDATSASTTFYPTSTATIQANFRSTLTYSLTVAAGSNVGTVTGSTDPVTLGSSYAITASNFTSGYEFNNWTASPAANATFASSTSASTNVTVKNGSVTVTATAREISRTITISGGTDYTSGETTTTAGVATAAKIIANTPAAGKKFTGWTLGSGVSLKGGYSLTDRTIEIYSTANATVTANYADRAGVKVYFAKPSSWSTAFVYAWKSSDDSKKNDTWPGTEMASTEVINNVTYYTYVYYTEGDGIGGGATGSTEWNSIKFTDNGDDTNRTADLTIADGHYYYWTSTTTGKEAAITSAWCIKFESESWNEDNHQIEHSNATSGSTMISISTGDKAFKVYNIVNTTWWRITADNITGNLSATSMNNNSGNMTLKPTNAGDYIFSLASLSGTPTLAVTFPPSLSFTATSVYSGDASTLTASVSNVVSGKTIKYDVYAGATATGDVVATYSTTTTTTTDSHAFSITPSFGASDVKKQYTVKVTYNGTQTATYTGYIGRKWDIKVNNNCHWENGVYYYAYGNGENHTWPGVECEVSCGSWYTVTLDGKYPNFILGNGNVSCAKEQTGNLTTSISTYAAGSTRQFTFTSEADDGCEPAGKNKTYTLATVTLSAPTVTLTKYDVISTTQIYVEGTITGYGNAGSTPADMCEVGFEIGETKYTTTCYDGNVFKRYITGLTAGTEYSVKAYATSPHSTAKSSATAKTTRATGSYTIKVRSGVDDPVPYIRAFVWSDDDCGGSGVTANASGNGVAMTLDITGTVYKWYSYSVSNEYQKFYINENASSTETWDQTAPLEETCYWYHHGAVKNERFGSMDCPYVDPQLMIESTPGGGFEYLAMSGSGPYTKTVTLAANSTYKFKPVYNAEWYGKASSKITRASNSASSLSASVEDNLEIETDFAGDYTFSFGTSGTIAVTYPTAYTVTFGAKYANIGEILTETHDGETGGTITAEDGNGAAIESGEYIIAGGSVKFTASPETGYELYRVAGSISAWYQKSNATKEYRPATYNADSTQLTLSSLNRDTAAYVVFKEKSTKVYIPYASGGSIKKWDGSSWVNLGGYSQYIGVTTTLRIKAVPNDGYYFKEWRKVGSDFTTNHDGALDNEDNYDLTLTGAGGGEQEGDTLEPVFAKLEEIYFYNTNGDAARMDCGAWSDVYVYFDITWEDGKVRTSSNSAYRVKMDNSLEMHAYVPRAYTRWLDAQPAGTHGKIAFSNQSYGTSTLFSTGYAASRGDYVKKMNLFYPRQHPKASTGGVDYYDNGYWWPYRVETKEGVGYYLKDKNGTQIGEFLGAYKYADYAEISYRIDEANRDVKFYIWSAGGETYKLHNRYTGRDTIYNSEMVMMSLKEGAADGFQIHTTSEGEYKFTIRDGVGGWLWLSVEYPVSAGDYRLAHSYNGRNKANSADSTYYTYSDVIKASKAGKNRRLSMYLSGNQGNSSVASTLKLQKCTSTEGGTPVWDAGDATNLGSILTKMESDGNGVYQFDIDSISTATDKVVSITSDSTRLYDGPFYIKTDCASGGWSNYTRNTMDVNSMNATAFDYYYVRWIDNNSTNVKCVIANDYCNQLSDTLKSDALLYRNSTWYETLPCASNVRFSYNSKTNVLKRAYLLGSTGETNFVTLVPNAAEYVYSAATSGTDYYSSNPKFSDNGNWTYQMDAFVYPGAKAGVKTTYPDSEPISTVYMIPTTNSLMGGTKGSGPRYHVRLVYDFKTEYLMSAYLPDGETIEEAIDLNTDLLYIRTGTSSGTQISFTGDGELKNVKHAYGVFQFPKDEMYNRMETWTSDYGRAYKYCRYYFSFPFDVKVSDIFGVGKMGQDWIIQKYNGEKRAKYGWFMETDTFWERVGESDTLKANTGYSLSLDRTNFNLNFNNVWANIPDHGYTYLYFPSMSATIGDIKATSGSMTVPELPCNIDREFSGKSHKNTDSNWTLFGVPAYADMKLSDDKLTACYFYHPEGNYWTLDDNLASTDPVFQAMHAYMVQWAGTFSWTQYIPDPVAPAPARHAQKVSTTVHLEMSYNGKGIDRTYVRLKEGANADFVLNEDGCKLINNNQPNIYAFAGAYEVGMSQVPVESQTVPVGVIIRKAGTYTFSMPENFDGTAILVDKFDGSRTNLAFEVYEVELPKGTINDRFELEININKVPTAIETVEGSSSDNRKVYKYIENGNLYIMEEGRIFDARGNRVK